MKKNSLKLLIIPAVVLTFIGSVLSTAYPMPFLTADGAVIYDSAELENYAERVAALVNHEREANGLPLLRYSETLSEAADIRAEEIQTYFSHTRPDGRSCFTAVTDMGIRYRYIGENIAYGQRSPEEVMNGWMNSSGHRANILSNNVEYIGIGVAEKNGVYYWTQFFAAADGLTGEIITIAEEPATVPVVTSSVTQTYTETVPVVTAVTTAVQKPAECSSKLDVLKALLKKYGIDLDSLLKR